MMPRQPSVPNLISAAISSCLTIYLAPVADAEYQNNQTLVLDLCDKPVIANPVSPKLSKTLTLQGRSNAAGTLQRGDAFMQKLPNAPLHVVVQLFKLPKGSIGQLNRPSQGALLPRPVCGFALCRSGRVPKRARPRTYPPDLQCAAGSPRGRSRSSCGQCAGPAFQGVFRWIVEAGSQALQPHYTSIAILTAALNETLELSFIQMLHDPCDILRMFPGCNQQRVVGFDHDQVLHSHGCNKLSLRVDEVPFRVQGEALPGNDHVLAVFAGAAMLVERGPGAKIIPSEACRDAIDARLAFALRRPRFENGVVDADALALGIELGECPVKAASSIAGGNLLQKRRRVRQMLAERVRQRPRTPNKHPAVPEKIAGPHEPLCDLGGRLLSEATDLEHSSCRLAADFDVAVTGFRASGRDANYNHILTASRNRRRPLDVLTKTLFVYDDVVGRKHSDHSSGIAPRQKKRRQANRRSRVSSCGFGDDLLLLQTLELAHNRSAQIFVGNDPELFHLGQRQKALHGFLDHALLAVERQ